MKNVLNLVVTMLIVLSGCTTLESMRRRTLRKGTVYSAPAQIAFELWNKLDKPIHFKIVQEGSQEGNSIITVQPNDVYSLKTDEIDASVPNTIYFYPASSPMAQAFKAYKISPNKSMYVRVKEKKGNFIFGPQTGAFLGIARSTDSGLAKKFNVTKNDIEEIEL